MDIGHHRRHPAHVVVLPERAFPAGLHFGDVALDRCLPKRWFDMLMANSWCLAGMRARSPGQHETAPVRGPAVSHDDAVANGQHEQRGRAETA